MHIGGYWYNSIPNAIEWAGTATFEGGGENNGLHYFGNPASNVLDMSGITISLDRTSGRGNYFCYAAGLSQILHFGDLWGNSRTMPSYVTGTYFWINMPSNCTTWNDSTSRITIAAIMISRTQKLP